MNKLLLIISSALLISACTGEPQKQVSAGSEAVGERPASDSHWLPGERSSIHGYTRW